jgi:hypothetical protein
MRIADLSTSCAAFANDGADEDEQTMHSSIPYDIESLPGYETTASIAHFIAVAKILRKEDTLGKVK